jgi:hypothetical protein
MGDGEHSEDQADTQSYKKERRLSSFHIANHSYAARAAAILC